VSDRVEFNVPLDTQQVILKTSLFSQSGTDNQTVTNREYTKRRITNANTNILALVIAQNHKQNLILKQFTMGRGYNKNCVYPRPLT